MAREPELDSCPECGSSMTTFTLGSVTALQCTSCDIICSEIVAEALK